MAARQRVYVLAALLAGCGLYGAASGGDTALPPADAAPPPGGFGPATTIATDAAGAWGIAVDATDVFWTNPVAGKVLAAPKTATGATPRVLASGQGAPTDIVVAIVRAFWSTTPTSADCGNSLVYAPKDGSAPPQPVDDVPAGECGRSARLVGRPQFVYAAGRTRNLHAVVGRIPVMGSGYAVVADEYVDMAPGYVALATDDASTFFARPGGPIQIAPGGKLADGDPVDLAVDDAALYWLTATGDVRKIDKHPDAGAPVELAAGQTNAFRIALDGDSVYFTALGASVGAGFVARVPKAGGAVEVLAAGQSNPRGIAVDASGVYWVDEGDGAVHRLPR